MPKIKNEEAYLMESLGIGATEIGLLVGSCLCCLTLIVIGGGAYFLINNRG